MITNTYEKLKMELKQELFRDLSELVMRESKDPEGEYRPEFVKKIIRISGKKRVTKNIIKQIS